MDFNNILYKYCFITTAIVPCNFKTLVREETRKGLGVCNCSEFLSETKTAKKVVSILKAKLTRSLGPCENYTSYGKIQVPSKSPM